MRIGIYTFRITERPTGMANYTIALTRALRSLDSGIEIILLNPHPEARLDWYSEFPVHRLPGYDRRAGRWAGLALAPLGLRRAAADLRLDILHAPSNVAPFIGIPPEVGTVATIHDLAPLALPGEHRLVARLGYRAMLPVVRRTADAVLTGSQAAAAELVRIGHLESSKIFVTPYGVDLVDDATLQEWRAVGVPEMGLAPGQRFILFVGDIRPRKNLRGVLQAFRQVIPRHPDLRLVVAGQAMHRSDEVSRQASDLGDSVLFTGYVSDETLHRLYASSSLLAMPSLAEGFGLPTLEAMAHGAPVLVSDLPVMREVVGDDGLIVDPFAPDIMAREMKRLLTDPDLAQRLSEAGRHRAAQFSWTRTAELTAAVYERVVARRRRHR